MISIRGGISRAAKALASALGPRPVPQGTRAGADAIGRRVLSAEVDESEDGREKEEGAGVWMPRAEAKMALVKHIIGYKSERGKFPSVNRLKGEIRGAGTKTVQAALKLAKEQVKENKKKDRQSKGKEQQQEQLAAAGGGEVLAEGGKRAAGGGGEEVPDWEKGSAAGAGAGGGEVLAEGGKRAAGGGGEEVPDWKEGSAAGAGAEGGGKKKKKKKKGKGQQQQEHQQAKTNGKQQGKGQPQQQGKGQPQQEQQQGEGGAAGPHKLRDTLQVSWLPEKVSRLDLVEMFGSHGALRDIRIIMKQSEDGRERLMGLVTFQTAEALEKALANAPSELRGSRIECKRSQAPNFDKEMNVTGTIPWATNLNYKSRYIIPPELVPRKVKAKEAAGAAATPASAQEAAVAIGGGGGGRPAWPPPPPPAAAAPGAGASKLPLAAQGGGANISEAMGTVGSTDTRAILQEFTELDKQVTVLQERLRRMIGKLQPRGGK